jgi:hypothetical protein
MSVEGRFAKEWSSSIKILIVDWTYRAGGGYIHVWHLFTGFESLLRARHKSYVESREQQDDTNIRD